MDSKERGAEADKATFIEEVGRNGRREFNSLAKGLDA